MNNFSLENIKEIIQNEYNFLYDAHLEVYRNKEFNDVEAEKRAQKCIFAMETLALLADKLNIPIKHNFDGLSVFSDINEELRTYDSYIQTLKRR